MESEALEIHFDDLPQKVKDYMAVMGNSLSGVKAMNIPRMFPKLGTVHPNGDPKYLGMLYGCLDPDGRYHFRQNGMLANRELSEQILKNKLIAVVEHGVTKSIEVRNPKEMIFSGAARGTREFHDWIFGVTGWPELIDDELTNLSLLLVDIIRDDDYVGRQYQNETGLGGALEFCGITNRELSEVKMEVGEIVSASSDLTFS